VLPLTAETKSYAEECGLREDKQASLVEHGFGKIVCVWGVLIAGTPKMLDSHLLYAANVAAEFLDPEGTGKP